jgi:hypothetical protein
MMISAAFATPPLLGKGEQEHEVAARFASVTVTK